MKQDWVNKKMGELCEVSTGKSNTEDANEDGQFAFFDRSRIIKKSTKYLFDCDAIIIAGEGQTFLPKFYSGKFDLHQRAYAIYNFNEDVSIHYVYKYLIYIHKYFADVAVGATAKSLRLRHFHDLPINYPPLSEQQRIVSILDQTFVVLDKAKENTQRNLQNAKGLFESYLQNIFDNKGQNWEEVKLSELATYITDGDHMPPPKTKEGIPFITISNINKESHHIDFSDTFTVSKEYYQKLKVNRRPQNGDVLYTVTGSYGIPVLIETDMEFCFQRHIGLIRPKENVINKWLFYWILSPQAINQANDTATGTAQKTVSLSALRNFRVPKMTLIDQQTIVASLDALSIETKRLEAIYQQKLLNLEELKKSVLQKVFNGEL